jgi:hypothetical protein
VLTPAHAEIVERTDGVPLFVEELTKGLWSLPNLTKPDIAAAIAKRPVSAELT